MTKPIKIKGCGSNRSECKNPPTEEIHPCPYDSDVNNDPTDKCHCCEDCAAECAADI